MELTLNAQEKDFQKEIATYMKYVNLNSPINTKQKNRFIKLFLNGKEQYMFLLLRIMNIYSISVRNNEQLLYSNPDFAKNILNYIFDPTFYSQYSFNQADFQILNDSEISEDVANQDDLDLLNISVRTEQENAPLSSPFDNYIFLKNFFDIHFYRLGDNIYFNAYYSYHDNHIIIEDNVKEYSMYLNNCNNSSFIPYFGKYRISVVIDDRFKQFIDQVFTSSTPNPQIFQSPIFYSKNQYWTMQKRQTLHNYINNFGIQIIFQKKSFSNCLINFNNHFYEWICNDEEKTGIFKLDNLQFSMQVMHFLQNDSETLKASYANDTKHCLSVRFLPAKSDHKTKPSIIKEYIKYFTMNSKSVLDNLALDFVNSILCFKFSHKNSIIYGDYDKFYKWVNLFSPGNIVFTNLIAFYPSLMPTQIINLIYKSDDEIKKIIKTNTLEVNVVRSIHKYFLINSHSQYANQSNKYTNYIDFPYGGEFYNLPPLSDVDKLEIVKLLIVHGWHLLNESLKNKKVETSRPRSSLETFINYLENTDETRIPINVLTQIYNQFIDSQISCTELRKVLEEKNYAYKTMDIRNCDKDYLQTLSNQAEKYFIKLNIPLSDKQKAISCKLNPEFWNEISPERKKETEDKNAAEFNEYLKELAEKYAPFFIEEAPEDPTIDNPLAGFVSPEKIKDEYLQ